MATWHPIMDLEEYEAGQWLMYDARNQPFAIIRILDVAGERGYRAVTWAQVSAERDLIGYYRTLRAAAMAAHQRKIISSGPSGAINGQ